MKPIDISIPLNGRTPIWPGSPGFSSRLRMAIDRGDDANVTELTLDVHTGTHVDAPLHFVRHGAPLGDIELATFVGPAHVVELGGVDCLDADALATAVPDGVERLLLRTANSVDPSFESAPFREDYVGLTLDGAEWLVSRGIRLVGIDYLSVQRFSDPPETHRVLLRAGICILEGLSLRAVGHGLYFLVCLPLRLENAEAAPARAVLFDIGEHA